MALTPDAVLDAAAALARTEGLDRLSLRAVAGALHVTPMALYRHIGDADALQSATVERVLAALPAVEAAVQASGGGDAWDDRCRRWAHGARAVLAATPGLPRHVLAHWTAIPRTLVAVDGLVAAMPPHTDAVAAANVVFTYVLVRAQAEEELRSVGVDRDLSTLRSMRAEVPFLWANHRRYQRAQLDEHFAFGLDTILRGIDARP